MPMETSHIWIGLFESDAPDDYFEEKYERDDGEPINRFAEEQGEEFYDHDWIEVSYLDADDVRDVRALVDGHSYSIDYIDAVCDRAQTLGLGKINVFVLADKAEFNNPKSVTGQNYRLEYLGQFNCNT